MIPFFFSLNPTNSPTQNQSYVVVTNPSTSNTSQNNEPIIQYGDPSDDQTDVVTDKLDNLLTNLESVIHNKNLIMQRTPKSNRLRFYRSYRYLTGLNEDGREFKS